MKKFSRTIFGLLASAMLVAGSVSFVSCSDDDEEETVQTVQTVEVKTTTHTVITSGNTYTYTTVDGKVTTSDSVVLNSNGTVTVSASDGSSVTFSADGNPIAYKTADNKTYTVTESSTESGSGVTFTSESGETVSAESTTETKTETKTTSGVSEATASVTVLAYDDNKLNNKVFSYEKEKDDGERYIRYLIFTGEKCYKSESLDYIGSETDELLISYNNKIYRSNKATRSSGSGLFATFDDGYECKYTLKSDGTGIINFYDNTSLSFTFTNNAGLVTISCTYEGEPFTFNMYYNGEILYDQKEELTFVKNYSAN